MSVHPSKHIKLVQEAYINLPDNEKHKMRRYGPFDRIKLKKNGVPSGLAAVYKIDSKGLYVAKVNVLDTDIKTTFATNNDYANRMLRPLARYINAQPSMAQIAVYDRKEYLTYNGITVGVTFERIMKGKTLQEKLDSLDGASPVIWSKLIDLLNKVKRTLQYLNIVNNLGFVHHDLHSGNLFVDDNWNPIIFDFDWATFDLDEYKDSIYKRMYQIAYRYFGSEHVPTYIPSSSCTAPQSWFSVNKAYSYFANGSNANSENVRKADLAMLLNDIINHTCNKGIPVDPSLQHNLDKKLDFKSKDFF